MLEELFKTGKLYGYITDYYSGGKGIVIANNEEDAKRKVTDAYLKHGYSESELTDLQVWKITEAWFEDASDVLEVWQQEVDLMTTENKLFNQIMEYWETCAYANCESDFAINDLLDDYALSCGIDERKIEARIDITVRNMTNSQKRKLYKMMLDSGIREKLIQKES